MIVSAAVLSFACGAYVSTWPPASSALFLLGLALGCCVRVFS